MGYWVPRWDLRGVKKPAERRVLKVITLLGDYSSSVYAMSVYSSSISRTASSFSMSVHF